MNGFRLINQANFWKSNDKWVLEEAVSEKSRIISTKNYRIKNISKNTVLGITENGAVTEQPLDENKKGQLWEKTSINEGYFTLTSLRDEGKLLTTTSDGQLETRGMNFMSFTDVSGGFVSLLQSSTIY